MEVRRTPFNLPAYVRCLGRRHLSPMASPSRRGTSPVVVGGPCQQPEGCVPRIMTANQVLRNSGNDEWYTPPEIIDAARSTLRGIELDPATNQEAQDWIQASRFFTIKDDALTKEWQARTVWMNPPYSGKKIGLFVERLCGAYLSGEIEEAIMLTNSATETKWFQLAAMCSQGLLLFSSRIKFIPQKGGKRKTPLQGQVLFLFGTDDTWQRFVSNFQSFGTILKVES